MIVYVLTYRNSENHQITVVFDTSDNAHTHAIGIGCVEYIINPCPLMKEHFAQASRLEDIKSQADMRKWKSRALPMGATLYTRKAFS